MTNTKIATLLPARRPCFLQDALLHRGAFHDAHVGKAGDRNILRAGDGAVVLADEIHRMRHAADRGRGRRIDADQGHVAGAAGRGLRRDPRRAFGAERMADDDDAVGGMRAGIGRKFAVLFEVAVSDDVAALAQPLRR